MVEVGLKGDEPSESLVAAAGKNHPEDVLGRDGDGGGGEGNDDFPPEREGGVLGDRAC